MDADYIEFLISIVLVIIGWLVGHYFSDKRAASSKKREIVTEYLIQAFRLLTNEISHRELTSERRMKLENILSDIQLFGSIEQVELAKLLADEVANGNVFDIDPLTNSLRDDLRSELNLMPISGNVRWLRFNT